MNFFERYIPRLKSNFVSLSMLTTVIPIYVICEALSLKVGIFHWINTYISVKPRASAGSKSRPTDNHALIVKRCISGGGVTLLIFKFAKRSTDRHVLTKRLTDGHVQYIHQLSASPIFRIIYAHVICFICCYCGFLFCFDCVWSLFE